MKHDFRDHRGRLIFALIVLCIGGVALTCSDNKCNCALQEDTGCEPATCDDLLGCFCEAYEGEDVVAYGDLLHERFRFYFTEDVAESMGLVPDEPWWGKVDDLLSTGNMFGSEIVTRVQIDIPEPMWEEWQVIRKNPEPDPPDTLEGFRGVGRPEISITIEEPGKMPLILLVDKSWLEIEVVPNPEVEGLWQVVTITETRFPYPPSVQGLSTMDTQWEQNTWGNIKSMFR